jgi:hypothetical protein
MTNHPAIDFGFLDFGLEEEKNPAAAAPGSDL